MAQTSWPFYNPSTGGTPVYEDQWSRMARQWAATGVVGYPNDTGLQVYANGSGREVHVRTGLACVRGHWFRSDAQETLAIAANTSGNWRVDRVVVRLDPSADGATLAVLTGTPGPLAATPALTVTDTGVYELTLARVTVASGAVSITAGNVVDERVHVAPPTVLGMSDRLPQDRAPGQRIFQADTARDFIWDGSQLIDPADASVWAAFGPWDVTPLAMQNSDVTAAISGATQYYRVKRVGNTCLIRGSIVANSGMTYLGLSPRQWILPLPHFGAEYIQAPVGRWRSYSAGNTNGIQGLSGDVLLYGSGHLQFVYAHAHPTVARGQDRFLVGNPGAADWSGGIIRPATGDIAFGFQAIYEIAEGH
jgi:hypothetical protein